METINGVLAGPYEVDGTVAVYGLIEGDAYVLRDGRLSLYGLATGDVYVEQGGVADIFGTVSGTVYNRGGVVAVHGTIGSLVDIDGSSTVDSGALIRDR